MDEPLDLFVIGAGSGGVRAARLAAQSGARVVVADGAPLGGTCVNLGCIPKKLYSYAAQYSADFVDAAGYGWDVGQPVFRWETLKQRRAAEVQRLNGVYGQLLLAAGVRIERGWARVRDPHTVEVQSIQGRRAFTAKNILLATGGEPAVPLFPGSEHALSSDAIFDLDPFPRSLLLVGGGYIACEFASIFNGLGASVTQLYRGEQILRGFDADVRERVATEMRAHGVDLRTGTDVEAIEKTNAGLAVHLRGGGTLQCDVVLYATGRKPRSAGLGLEAAGVALDANGAVLVDDDLRTSVPHIFAVGDVTGRVQLTPVALAEAMVVVDRLFGTGQRQLSYDLIPTAVFTHPNVATVGLTEAQARERFGNVTIFRSEFRSLRHTLSGRVERTLMKLVVDAASDQVVGLHMVGAEAGEIVQGFAVAMKAGATKQVFDSTIGIHPTAAEEFLTMR